VVDVPSWRATKDVSLKADLVEELTRIYGYDNFEVKSSRSLLSPVRDSAARSNDWMFKDILVLRHALHEVHSYVWCDEKKFRSLGIDVEENVSLVNGAAENSVMRNSMLPTLLAAAAENKNFADTFGIFEIGRIVRGTDGQGNCDERRTLGAVLFSKEADEEALYFKAIGIVNDLFVETKHIKPRYEKKAPLHKWQHPKNTRAIYCGGVEVGTLCAIHPYNRGLLDKSGVAGCIELDMKTVDELTPEQMMYQVPSRFPAIDYDLTVHLESDSEYGVARSIIEAQNLADLQDVKVADVYRGHSGVNITVRLRFASAERTLVREDVQAGVDGLIAAWKVKGIELSQ
jgi:phenylalanyl-tRNA synthetase beta chain